MKKNINKQNVVKIRNILNAIKCLLGSAHKLFNHNFN